MRQVDRELDRYVALLRNKIRQKGFTQMEVQESLGWGRSYISQIVTRQKNLRMDQILRILGVISVPPEEFFGELYQDPEAPGATARQRSAQEGGVSDPLRQELGRVHLLLRALVKVLLDKRIVTSGALKIAEREAMASD